MADPPSRSTATPADFPVQPSPHNLPGADFSYTVEVVSTINSSLGKLTEAVETLKKQIEDHGKKIDDVRMDVHAAKAVFRTLLWVVGVVGTLLGLFLSAYFRQVLSGGR